MDEALLEPPPFGPPQRQLDTVAEDGLDDLIADEAGRALIVSRDFPQLYGLEVQPESVQVVLYDASSVDSFAACLAARRALGDRAVYEGVDRSMGVEDLSVDVGGQVVAMVGVCWSVDSLHDLISECDWLFIVDTHLSVMRELEQFTYPSAVRILDCDMGAGALAWNFFFPGEPVPAMLRVMEDVELGRGALRSSAAFADGFEAAFNLQPPRGEVKVGDESFKELELLLEEGHASIARAVEEGLRLADGLRALCSEAERRRSVRTLRGFPAWRCALVNLATPFAARIGGHLAEALVADGGDLALERSFAAVFEVRGRRVQVVLRSLPGGPDVSEVAQEYRGSGRPNHASFSVFLDEWEDLWVQPEPVLWDTTAVGPRCLALSRGERVTIAHRGERFKESPCDQWSWGYRSDDHLSEGWIPTLAHTLFVATRSASSDSHAIQVVEEGDLLVARGQKGKFLWGTNQRAAQAGSSLKGWFPHLDGLWQPVHPTSVREIVEGGRLGT